MASVNYRLLMVEDSADDAELLLYALRDAPFKFTSVRVETEAEYDAALAKALPDVVLCDYNLPRFSSERALKFSQSGDSMFPLLSFPTISAKTLPWQPCRKVPAIIC